MGIADRSYRLTPAEIEIFKRSMDPSDGVGANWFLGYYFERQFMPWQFVFHHAPQQDLTVIGGTGSGKTVGAALSYATYAATMPRFSFMNLAPTSWQSKLMYNAIMREMDGKPFENFIYKAVERPYPKIILRNNYIGESTMHFMSAADDATRIQGWEGDAMNLDEAGLITEGDALIGMMATRLRGSVSVPGGGVRRRMGRLSIITASYVTAPPWLWQRMDMMNKDPEHFLSMTVKSAEAGTLSKEDIEAYRRRIPPEQQALLLDGARPEGAGEHFTLKSVNAIEDLEMNRWMQHHTMEKDRPTPGWKYVEEAHIGCTHWEMPAERGRSYVLIGDPGQGNPPMRNAGVVAVWDVTNFPDEPARLRFFKWVFGHGSYTNFLNAYEYAYKTYRPIESIIDSTGTQSLWNEQVLLDRRIWATGFDFSGRKNAMLVAAMNIVEKQMIRIPFIQGMRTQLVNYSVQKDKKLAQDIVVTIMMLGYYLRAPMWEKFNKEESKKRPQKKYIPSTRNIRRRVTVHSRRRR